MGIQLLILKENPKMSERSGQTETPPFIGQPAEGDRTIPVSVFIDCGSSFYDPFDDSPYSSREISQELADHLMSVLSSMTDEEADKAFINIRLKKGTVIDTASGGPVRDPGDLVLAVRQSLIRQRDRKRREFREVNAKSKKMLIFGFIFAMICLVLSNLYLEVARMNDLNEAISQSFVIIGWVIFWHPVEFFLYDRREMRQEVRDAEAYCSIPIRVTESEQI